MLSALAGHDPRDPSSVAGVKVPEYAELLGSDLTGIRVGVGLSAAKTKHCEMKQPLSDHSGSPQAAPTQQGGVVLTSLMTESMPESDIA